jgi:hypothetical protein
VEETCDKNTLRDLAEAAEVRVQQQTAIKNKLSAQIQDIAFRPPPPPPQSGTRYRPISGNFAVSFCIIIFKDILFCKVKFSYHQYVNILLLVATIFED